MKISFSKQYLDESHCFKIRSNESYFVGKTCDAPADLIFLLDGSASIGDDFQRQFSLVSHVVDHFGGVSNAVHAAVVVISTRSTVEIRLNDFTDNEKFINAVKNVGFVFLIFNRLLIFILQILFRVFFFVFGFFSWVSIK